MIKNLNTKEIISLKDKIEVKEGEVISKTISQNEHYSLTLFSFSKNEEIGTHKAGGDAFLTVLEGKAKIKIDNEEFVVEENKTIIMPKNHPHSVFALTDFKMILLVLF